jgi:hypothetical protein
MRTAGLPTFRKLFGVINESLIAAQTYYVQINSTYDVSSFKGTKMLVLSTTNKLGGTNYFLAIAYIAVGAICILLSIIFKSIHMK